ncbi:diguanylate cyclase [Lacrimispora sp.]|uniref:sensor domain-containing diguanylate cyclase n=1 Tax=Lacrimispora sp. TaxID=2719234 RepID=UPI0039E4ED98
MRFFVLPFTPVISVQAYQLSQFFSTHRESVSNAFTSGSPADPGPLYYFTVAVFFLAAVLIYRSRRKSPPGMEALARAQVVEDMQDAFIVCDSRFCFLDANQSARLLFPELNDLTPGEAIKDGERFKKSGELRVLAGGKRRTYEVTHTHIRRHEGGSGICIILHDITEREKLLEQLYIQAAVDPLMNIYNRGAFFRMSALMVEKEKGCSYALLMIDVDYFKIVNDTYGHQCGDAVLKVLGRMLKENFGGENIVGRYGGEEMIALLKAVSPPQALDAAERFCKNIESAPVFYRNCIIRTTVSIGVGYSPSGKDHLLQDMLFQADQALYQAKNEGRNRACLYQAKEIPL